MRSGTRVMVFVGAASLLGVIVVASFAIGSRAIAPSKVITAFTDFDGSLDHRIVREARLPRAVVAVFVGAALAAAGTLMQGLTRNPLADPGILGIEAGASLGVVVGLRATGWIDLRALVWFAFVGAGIAAVIVLGLGSSGRGGADPIRLVLAGAATTALLSSITTGLLLSSPSTLDAHRFWIVGSVKDRDLDMALRVAPFLLLGLALTVLCASRLDTLALGEDVARSLGVHVGRVRLLTAFTVVVLAGAAVSIAGPIGFVGLTIPHLGRAILGHHHRRVLAFSLLGGPVMLLAADLLGRVTVPGELQTGVVTAAVGAPVLIAVVRRRQLGGL